MPVYNDIPKAQKGNEDSVLATIEAIVQNIQVLTGKIGGTGAAVSLTLFRKTNSTDPDPIGTKRGDLWWTPPISLTDKWVRRVWDVGPDGNGFWRIYDNG